jgi:hypothetical protein
MAFRLTPSTVNQACNVPAVSASGKPEEKPSSSSAAMRRLPNTWRSSCHGGGFAVLAGVEEGIGKGR